MNYPGLCPTDRRLEVTAADNSGCQFGRLAPRNAIGDGSSKRLQEVLRGGTAKRSEVGAPSAVFWRTPEAPRSGVRGERVHGEFDVAHKHGDDPSLARPICP